MRTFRSVISYYNHVNIGLHTVWLFSYRLSFIILHLEARVIEKSAPSPGGQRSPIKADLRVAGIAVLDLSGKGVNPPLPLNPPPVRIDPPSEKIVKISHHFQVLFISSCDVNCFT